MKLKIKVTSIFAICFLFCLTMVNIITSKTAKETLSDKALVTKKLEIVGTDHNTESAESDIDDAIQPAKEEVETTASTASAARTVAMEDDKAESVDVLDVIDEEAAEALENTFISTLSIAEPEIEFDQVLPKVKEYLNIRKEADESSEVIGKLYKNSYAKVLKRGDEWTKITSNGVTGYAHTSYLYFDEDAIDLVKSLDAFKAVARANGVNIRQKPDVNSKSIGKTKQGDTFTHVPEMDTDSWTAVRYGDDNVIAYISSKFVTEKINLKGAVSIEEEKKQAEEAKKAKEAEEKKLKDSLAEAKKTQPSKTTRAAVKVSDEDLFLLSVVVAMEAGSEPYEGQLAVANVVVNRMLDGYWGDSIPDVVYAKGQFSGANSGRIEKFSTRVTESNKRAAVEALAGNNNIGDYMFFIMKSRANYSSYKKYYVLGGHCFYAR